MRKMNFAAGPSVMPLDVLEELKKNLVDYLFHGVRIGCMLYIGMHMFMGAM